MSDTTSILVVGATGMMGAKIADTLIERGAHPRLMIRPGGYDGAKAEAIAALAARGATTVEADLAQPDTLGAAVEGIDTVVSAVQGLEEIIVDGQGALLDAAEHAAVKRFIPSDFSVDLFEIPDGSNRNLDLRRRFNRKLDTSSVAGTSVLNGAFMEMLVYGFPLLDREAGRFVIWGDPEQKLQFTATDDAAAYAADAALDPDAPRKLCIAGSEMSQLELQEILEGWLGTALKRHEAGDADALAAEIEREKVEAPGANGDLFPRWQALQYLHNMISGDGYMTRLDDDRHPRVEPTSLEAFLSEVPVS